MNVVYIRESLEQPNYIVHDSQHMKDIVTAVILHIHVHVHVCVHVHVHVHVH